MSRYNMEKAINVSIIMDKVNSKSNQPHSLSIIAKNFVSSLFQETLYKIKDNENKEGKIVSNFISSLFDELKMDIIISNFIESVFEEAKTRIYSKKILNIEMTNNIDSNKDIIKERRPNLILQAKVINNNICVKGEHKSPYKNRKVHFNISCDSNASTFSKSNICCETFGTKGSFKNKRNSSIKKKDRNINTFDCKKCELSKEYLAKKESYKEKDQYEKKIEIIKRHISVMKKRQDEINRKISVLKSKENNLNKIRKEKTFQKRVIHADNEKKKSDLIQKRHFIEEKKKAENLSFKRSLGRTKLDKIKKYKQIKGKNKELLDKMKSTTQKNNITVKNIIEKIRTLREFNKNIIPQRKRILHKKNAAKNVLECKDNIIKSQLLKIQIKHLQNVEKEYLNDISKTQEKYNNFYYKEHPLIYHMKCLKK